MIKYKTAKIFLSKTKDFNMDNQPIRWRYDFKIGITLILGVTLHKTAKQALKIAKQRVNANLKGE